MARGGGRGGGGGGSRGGGRPRSGTTRIAGIDIVVEEGLEDGASVERPGELFPKRDLKPFRPLSKDEKAQVAAYLSIRDQIRARPLYTVLGEEDRRARDYAVVSAGLRKAAAATTGSGGGAAAFIADPFESGVEMHSLKYTAKKRRLPGFEREKCVLQFFPKELWGVFDPKYASLSGAGRQSHGPERKKKKVSEEDETAKAKKKLDAAAKKAAAEERAQDDEAEDLDDEDQEGRNSDQDDDFDEDDDDMVGDYNAEQYFDDGGDDAGDDYDGGDGGGDDGMY